MTYENRNKNLEIEIIYNPEKNTNKNIRIFGKFFVRKNKEECKIIYKNKEFELTEYFEDIDKTDYIYIDYIQLTLRIIKNITDVSYMFHQCETLYSFPDKSQSNNYQTTYINNENIDPNSLASLFDQNNNSNLSVVNEIYHNDSNKKSKSKLSSSSFSSLKRKIITFNTGLSQINPLDNSLSYLVNSKVTNMSGMFYNCKALKELPDISKWNTSNVIYIDSIFYGCESLMSLPDISKWNISNVIDMDSMFYRCESLISLSDISKWNISNVTEMGSMFFGCISLITIPDISNWNLSNMTKIYYMFSGCISLITLPDISKWNTTKVKDMSFIFKECNSLISIPDLSKWKISKDTFMKGMFDRCYYSINIL